MDSKLYFLSSNILPKNLIVDTHQHNCFELVYYTKGSGVSKIEDKKFCYSKNQFIIIPPNSKHSEYFHTEVDCIALGFSLYHDNIQLKKGLFSDKNNVIIQILKKIKTELTDEREYFELQIKILLYQLALEVCRINNTKNQNADFDFIKILNYINENIEDQDLNTKTLAKIHNLSYDRFRHKFKETMGYTSDKYILFSRLKLSLMLLKDENLSILDIAMQSGFSSPAQFSTIFKKHYGYSPQEYKKLCKKND